MNRPEIERSRSPRGLQKSAPERIVVFTVIVEGEKFGLPIDCVRTIFRPNAITEVPLAPARMIGLINLRGHVVTAICMRTALGLPRRSANESLMVAVEHNGEGFALAVDNVGDVAEMAETDRISMPAMISPSRRAMTTAVYRMQDSIIPLLNIEILLGAESQTVAA